MGAAYHFWKHAEVSVSIHQCRRTACDRGHLWWMQKKIRLTVHISVGLAKHRAKPTRPRGRDVAAIDVLGDLATTAHEQHPVRGVATGGSMALGLRGSVHPCHRVRIGKVRDREVSHSR